MHLKVSLADILTTRCGYSRKASLIIIVHKMNYCILYFSFTKELQLVTIHFMVDAYIMSLMMSLCNGTRNDGSEFANMLIFEWQSIKHGGLKYSLSHNNRKKNKALDYPQLIKRSNRQVPAQFDFAGTKTSIASVHPFRFIHKKIGSIYLQRNCDKVLNTKIGSCMKQPRFHVTAPHVR